MKQNELETNEVKREKAFSKKVFLKSAKYNKDIISAILEDDKVYTEREVKNKIEKYLKGRVI